MLDQGIKLFHLKVYIHLRSCLTIGLILVGYTVGAQKVIRNDAGEKIIKYEDGTWRYFEGRDSMLENDLWEDISKSDQEEIDLPKDQPMVYDYLLFQKYIAAAVRYESQMLDRVDASSIRAHALEDQILSLENINDTIGANQAKAEFKLLTEQRQNDQRRLSYARSLIKKILKVGKSEKYIRLAKIYVPGLNTEAELSEQDALHAGQNRSDLKKPRNPNENHAPETIEEKVQILPPEEPPISDNSQLPVGVKLLDSHSDSVDFDSSAAITLGLPETSTGSSNPEYRLDSLKADPEKLVANPKILTEEAKNTDSAATRIPQEAPLDSSQLTDLTGERQQDSGELEPSQPEQSVMDPKQNESAPLKKEIALARYSAAGGNHWFSSSESKSPKYQCEFAFHGIDEFTKTQKKELKDELFFSYTDERLKSYLKDQDYMSCRGYLTSISGGFRYLTLVFSIASKNANREYGYIKNGSLLNLKLLDGETVSLFTQSENQGLIDPKTGNTIYKVRYPIDYQKEKLLLKSGIDKVRVVWSSGYEDYEVFNIDFFTNQLGCLNSK